MTLPTACRQGPMVRIHLPPAVSQVRTAIGPPELPSAPRKQSRRRPPQGTEGSNPPPFGCPKRAAPAADELHPARRSLGRANQFRLTIWFLVFPRSTSTGIQGRLPFASQKF